MTAMPWEVKLNWFHGFFSSYNHVTLVLATDGDQVFHWWRGTTLCHGPPVKRGSREESQRVSSFLSGDKIMLQPDCDVLTSSCLDIHKAL